MGTFSVNKKLVFSGLFWLALPVTAVGTAGACREGPARCCCCWLDAPRQSPANLKAVSRSSQVGGFEPPPKKSLNQSSSTTFTGWDPGKWFRLHLSDNWMASSELLQSAGRTAPGWLCPQGVLPLL